MLVERPAFEIDGAPYTIGEALAAARLGGVLGELERSVREELVLDLWAEGPDEPDEPSVAEGLPETPFEVASSEIQAGVDAWRKEHDLIAADDVKEWLERHALELSDLVDHVRRGLLRKHLSAHLDAITEAIEPDPSDLDALIPAEAAFRFELEKLILEIAQRHAAEPPADPKLLPALKRELVEELAAAGGIEAIGAAFGVGAGAPCDRLLHGEALYRAKRREIATDEALNRELSRSRRNLGRIEYAVARFDTAEVANEVYWCLKQDNKWLEPLGDNLGFPTERHLKWVEELESSAVSTMLASGKPGDVCGPAEAAGKWVVYEVLGRIEPALSDAELRERVERRIVSRALASGLERRARVRYGIR